MKRSLFGLIGLGTLAAMPAAAQPALPACVMDGLDWRSDAVFRASRRAEAGGLPASLICRTTEVYSAVSGPVRLTVRRAKVYEPRDSGADTPGIEQGVNLYTVLRVTPTGEEPVGQVLAAYDVARDKPFIDPRVGVVDGEPILTLGWGLDRAYRVTPQGLVAFDAHGWVARARDLAGPGLALGQVRLVDFDRMAGYVAGFPAQADDPARPASALGEHPLLKAHLAFQDGRLVTVRVERVDRAEIQDVEESAAIADREEWAREARRRVPAGTEPCELSGWSVDADAAGLNVRAQPSGQARILGRVPPPWTPPGGEGEAATYRAEFDIAGYRDGWFLIRNIRAPGADYGETYPRGRPQPFRGQGWVSARMVGAALANGGLPAGHLLQAPNEHAATRPVSRAGEPVSTGDVVQKLLACSGRWGLIEIEGVRGWWTSLCSNQVTNCS